MTIPPPILHSTCMANFRNLEPNIEAASQRGTGARQKDRSGRMAPKVMPLAT